MIDEKKLIEELQIQIERERKKCNDMVELNLGDLVAKYNHGEFCYVNALHLVQTQPKVGEWIPIGQFPSEPCLLCFESGHRVVGYYDFEYDEWRVLTSNGFETDLTEDDLEDGEPIAWMPLPEAYKEEVTE